MTRARSKGDRRRYIWQKANGVCAHCGRAANAALQTVDHVIPLSLGGGNDLRNLMPLCYSCNEERQSEEVEPTTFYCYAEEWAIDDFLFYRQKWERERRDSCGELIVEESEHGQLYGGDLTQDDET